MTLHKAKVTNFGSFRELEFNFDTPGLSLIHGPTGSGKSTLIDITSWILYGITAKDGSVDDIRSWTSDGVTTGTLEVSTQNGRILVTRVRGSTKQNDLFWEDEPGIQRRGKDVTETQRLLEERLGVSSNLYHSGASYTEFSRTGAFFHSKAKERRTLFEQIAALDFSVKLAEKLKAAKQQERKDFVALQGQRETKEARIDESKRMLKDIDFRIKDFDRIKSHNIAQLLERSIQHEQNVQKEITRLRSEIQYLEETVQIETCPTCGAGKDNNSARQIIRLNTDCERHLSSTNPYLSTLEKAQTQENPFLDQEAVLSDKIYALKQDVNAILGKMDVSKTRLNDLERLLGITDDLRTHLLTRSVSNIQDSTNKYLETHFDSELRVTFNLEGADSLNVSILKSGYEANYKQLSKGQRTLLKLCFSLSVMKVAANRAGVHFDTLFLDEALDGLDSDLKVKAFGLLQALNLEHKSIFIVDHAPEFQNLFTQKYHVEMVSDESHVYE